MTGDHRDLHVLTHSFPTRRASDLKARPMSSKSIAKEAQDIELASRMIRLGARIQVLQEETKLSYDRLTKLYREIHKRSPPKGMLPFSIDWRSEEHTSELQSLMRISYAVFCLKQKKSNNLIQ